MLLLRPDAEALAAFQTGLSLARELGSTIWIVSLATQLGRAYLLNQNLPQAQATLQAVMPREQHPRTMPERHIALAWGELALAQGEPDMALQIAEHLLASVPGLVPGQPVQPIPHLLKLKGEALLALSRLDDAVAALEEAREGAVARNDRPILWTIHRVLGQAYRLLHREEQARQELAAARQRILARDSGAELETHLAELAAIEAGVAGAAVAAPAVENGSQPLREVALEVWRLGGWDA